MSLIKFVRDDGKILELDYPWGICEVEGLGYPDVSFETEAYAFEDGSYWTKNQAEKRVISFKAKSQVRDDHFLVRDRIGKFFNHLADYELYIDFEGKDAYFEGKVTDFEIPLQKSNALISFTLEFTSTNPFIQSVSNFGKNLNEVKKMIHYPRRYLINEKKPYSVRVFNQNVKIDNDGIVDTGFMASITFAEATSTFGLQNHKGQKLEFLKSFAAGDILQIDTKNKVARLNGAKFYKGISNDSEFFPLYPGENFLTYHAAAGESTLDIDVYYRSQRVVF